MKAVKIRVPVHVSVDVKTTSSQASKRPKRRELKPEQAAGFAKKEALRKLRGARYFGERF